MNRRVGTGIVFFSMHDRLAQSGADDDKIFKSAHPGSVPVYGTLIASCPGGLESEEPVAPDSPVDASRVGS